MNTTRCTLFLVAFCLSHLAVSKDLLDEVTQTINREQQPKPRVIKPKPPVTTKKATRRAPEIEMIAIPAGRYTMGCQDGRDKECFDDEKPAHTVSLSAFELGKYEVTQGQWKAVMGSPPPGLYFKNCGDDCPVERVSWDDIQTFIQKLNAQTGKTYRLPSEAEWEYACRAGQDTNYCGGNDVDSVAWYGNNSGSTTHPVGKKQANAWGLYDMSGNVWEWVQDTYHDSYKNAPSDGSPWEGARADARVLRGGSWCCNPQDVRAAYRDGSGASIRYIGSGFRLARTLP